MLIRNYIEKETYYDSVLLMRLGREIASLDGVGDVSVGMGTPLNKDTLEELGLLCDGGRAATPNDLIIALSAANENAAQNARDAFLRLLMQKKGVPAARQYQSLDVLSRTLKDRNLAVISLAGRYAGAETEKALRLGMNVFLFSDNVPLEQEVRLKRLAEEKGLLLMGPDCGLSFIGGTAIGLCSKVRRGPIGIAAASGSGMQEVMNILHKNGQGVSHAIGVGGRDLRDEVGGITILRAIRILEEDPSTAVIALISKPPGKVAEGKVLASISRCTKPVVVQFIGSDPMPVTASGTRASASFEETALIAAALAGGKPYVPESEENRYAKLRPLAESEAEKFTGEQRYLRGIYCGGSLAEESMTLTQRVLGPLYSNVAPFQEYRLADPFQSCGDCLIDIGAEEFTAGRPHVAIDPAPRIDRFLREAQDPETAVILMDFLLGYSLCEDPAGMMAEAIKSGIAEATAQGRHLCVIASVCGSDLDPQNLPEQERKLRDAGVIVMEHNGAASRLAAAIIRRRREITEHDS